VANPPNQVLARKWKTIKRVAKSESIDSVIKDSRKKVTLIAFKHQMTKAFPLEFDVEGWVIIDFNDRNKYKTDYYLQVNVEKPDNKTDETHRYIKNTGKPYLVCELSCFRQNSYRGDPDEWYFTLGWFHFLRQGYFHNNNCNPDRWTKIAKHQNISIKPWNSGINKGNDYALICLQKVNDSTMIPMHETHGKYKHWLLLVINQIRNHYPQMPIVIRPHLRTKAGNYEFALEKFGLIKISDTWQERNFFEGGDGLLHDLSQARFVVSYNSNVLTQCAIAGKPAICWDIRSMAAPMCLDPSQIGNISQVHNINREQVLYNLSYTQWSRKEIRDGTAWNHLKQYGF
tara:strand:- start:40513 stop:41541 length:1029 start_codon:yes stop_codon:yes gene_type:complete